MPVAAKRPKLGKRLKLGAIALLAGQLAFVAEAVADTCEALYGSAEEASALVELCLEVSPATRPPCNPDNDCQLITDEIIRGCAFLGEDAPQVCEVYAQ